MPAAQLTICESTNRWGLALRGLFTSGECRIEVASNMADAFNILRQQTEGVLAVEVVESNAEECLSELCSMRRHSDKACVFVLLGESLADSDDGPELAMWYEAGAAAVVVSPQRLNSVYRLVLRHIETSKKQPTTFREKVWQRMPWSYSEIASQQTIGDV